MFIIVYEGHLSYFCKNSAFAKNSVVSAPQNYNINLILKPSFILLMSKPFKNNIQNHNFICLNCINQSPSVRHIIFPQVGYSKFLYIFFFPYASVGKLRPKSNFRGFRLSNFKTIIKVGFP